MADLHNHSHAHHHGPASHGPADFGRAFRIGIGLNLGFVALEAAYGIIAHSLALLADAGHNLSDVLGLALAWFASTLARRAPTPQHTYGLRGSTILAALSNSVLLYIAIGAIAWEAVRRFGELHAVNGGTVVGVAAAGIAVNAFTALLFRSGHKGDVNIRGAYLHMAADAAVSLGVVISGILISASGWLWIDPVVSLAIVAVIGIGTWGLLKESANLALHAVPEGIDAEAVERYLAGIPGIMEVHDLHIWGMSTTETALTAHLVKPEGVQDDALLARICDELHHRFGIQHSTIQLESGDAAHPCNQAPADVV
ncbi:MAG: cation transporter [Bacteroidetes bacterium]|nr:cation transporter [Bacteroidota bacterium]